MEERASNEFKMNTIRLPSKRNVRVRVKKLLQKHILYLTVVNAPIEEEVAMAEVLLRESWSLGDTR